MAHPLWPLFDLRLRTDRLELRLPTDDDLILLAELALGGIHPPELMPFAFPWTDRPSPQFERGFARYHWSSRGEFMPLSWSLELMVSHDGVPIGMQGAGAKDFATTRLIHTGSWLGGAHQRRGFRREMRTAVLAFAFDGLGAEVAESEAFLDNPASAGVSRALGYAENGIGRHSPRGEPRDTLRFRMTREMWHERPRPRVEIENLELCLELFGLTAPAGTA